MLWFLSILIITQQSQCAEFKKHVQNSVYPYDIDPPNYNIESWAKLLHLQQCAFVEVGDNYYAVFVETRPRRYDKEKDITDYFLGLCDEDNLRKWDLCSPNLMQKRSADCRLTTPEISGARVHRRLCDVTTLAMNAPQCDCNGILSDSKLFKVQGFPTCFKPPLPDSLCGDNNVCGLASCTPQTINKRVHTAKCDRRCLHEQPFCEIPNRPTSKPRRIRSFWTDWSNPFCTDASCISQFDAATCINRDTWEGDIDCLGPGTSCCTPELQNCRCHVYEEDGTSKVFRTFSIPQPEVVEYMSEEDFINSIPLQFLNKEEFHKYPHQRLERSRLGKAIKQTVNNIYESRPIRLGNTKIVRQDSLRQLKSHILKSFSRAKQLRAKSKVVAKSALKSKLSSAGHATKSLIHAPASKSVADGVENKALATKSVPDVPASRSVVNVPAAKSVADIPAAKSVADVPAPKSVADVPTIKSMADVPAAKAVPDVPEIKSMADVSEVRSVANVPAAKASADVSASRSVPDSPAVKSTDDVAVAAGSVPAAKSSSDVPVSRSVADSPAVKSNGDVPAVGSVHAAKSSAKVPAADAPAAKTSADAPVARSAAKSPADVPAMKKQRSILPFKRTKTRGEPPYQITILLEEEKDKRTHLVKKSDDAQMDDCEECKTTTTEEDCDEKFEVSTVQGIDLKEKCPLDIVALTKVEATVNDCASTSECAPAPPTTTDLKIKQDDFEDSLNWEEDVDEGLEPPGDNENDVSLKNYHQKTHDEDMAHPNIVFSREKVSESDDDDNEVSTEGKSKRKIRDNSLEEDEDEVLRKNYSAPTVSAVNAPVTTVLSREEEDEDETRAIRYRHKHKKKNKLRTVIEEEISDDDDDDEDDDSGDDIMIEYDEVTHNVILTTTTVKNITESIKNITETSSFIRTTNIYAIYIVPVVLLF